MHSADEAAFGRFSPAMLTLKLLLLVVAGFLLWPAFHSVHPEGFSAQVQMAAMAANEGLLDQVNATYPLHTEYFYLTRAGVVMLLQALMTLTASLDDNVFRLLMLLTFASLIMASLSMARSLSGVGRWWAGAALLLAPGIAELPFYFQDNLPAAAFGVFGLALLSQVDQTAATGRRPQLRAAAKAIVAGASIGFAIACRIDTLFVLPLALALLWLRAPGRGDVARGIVLFTFGVCAALLAVQAYSGASVLQSLAIGRIFNALPVHTRGITNGLRTNVYLLGLVHYVVLPFGMFLQWQRAPAFKARLTLVVLPAVLLLGASFLANETRQLYPLLTGFIALWGGRALHELAGPGAAMALRTSKARRIGLTGVALLTAAAWLTPPLSLPYLKDGPRLPFGRLWSISVWREWQASIARDREDVQQLVIRSDKTPRLTVITTHYNNDPYLRLTMWQHGLRPATPVERTSPCTAGFERWLSPRGEHEVFVLRTENPHVFQRPDDYVRAVQLQHGLQCLRALAPMPVVVSGLFPLERSSFIQIFSRARRDFAQLRDDQRPMRASNAFPANRSTELSKLELDSLRTEADRFVEKQRAAAPSPLPDFDTLMARFSPQVAWVRYENGRAKWFDVK